MKQRYSLLLICLVVFIGVIASHSVREYYEGGGVEITTVSELREWAKLQKTYIGDPCPEDLKSGGQCIPHCGQGSESTWRPGPPIKKGRDGVFRGANGIHMTMDTRLREHCGSKYRSY